MEWISVKNRLPDEKTPVLVTWTGISGKVHSDAVAAIIHGKWYWWEISVEDSLEFENKCTFVQITHWMPLPPPPGIVKEDSSCCVDDNADIQELPWPYNIIGMMAMEAKRIFDEPKRGN